MDFELHILGPEGLGRTIHLRPGQTFVLGRSPEAGLRLIDRQVSRRHCEIHHLGPECVLVDLGSRNGTWVNGERVRGRRALKPGDRVRVGTSILEYTAAEQAGGMSVVRITEEHTIDAFLEKHPGQAANVVITRRQIIWYLLVLLALLFVFQYELLAFFHVVHLLCCSYLVVAVYKLLTVLLSLTARREIRATPEEIASLTDEELPVYTILVPLFREKEVARKIIRAIEALDYPKDKLDVKLLLEPEDRETLVACEQAQLPDYCEVIVCPVSQPKTKPKACNHGLGRAQGEYLVIFDAEDRPEPDQLKKAVLGFRKVKERVICLQAKLNYFNPRQNALTKWFTVEYSTWFDLFLPGLHAMGAPIPLGGTSNHFKTNVLRQIGGWDPFNVTEDCDLGIRLHRLGYRTQVLDSTTWEEANSRLGNWIRQRSRWVKGYIQTHLVHMRQWWRTLRQLGPLGMMHFLLSVGGLSLMLLLNPIFWLVGAVYLGCWAVDLAANHWSVYQVLALPASQRWSWQMWFDQTTNPGSDPTSNAISQVFYYVTIALLLGNLVFIATHVIACLRRKDHDLVEYAIFSPIYWVLISIGAWKGFLQLFSRPFYWEKTRHGLVEEGEPPLPQEEWQVASGK